MRRPPPGIPDISSEVYKALAVFTDEEIALLNRYYLDTTGEFWGIGFVNDVTGKVTKWANLAKYNALLVLEEACRQECSRIVR